MIRLVLSDMDNTLVPFGRPKASQRTIDAIHACQEQGIDFGPASGRDSGELARFFDDDASCFNTGVLVNGQRVCFLGEVVYEKSLPYDQLHRVERVVQEIGRCALLTYRDNGFADWVGETREQMGPIFESVFKCGGAYHEFLPDYPVIKAGIVFHDDETRRKLEDAVEQRCPDLMLLNTVDEWLDVALDNWTKADGVRILQRVLGLAPEEVCVFGDAENDLAMLSTFPNSCAVANASKEASEAAHWHVGASADDGVAIALEQIAEAGRVFNETGDDVLPAFMRH